MEVDQTALAQPADIGAEEYYHQLLAKGVLAIQQCTGCEQYVFYPRMLCPHCGGEALRWHSASGMGSVDYTNVVRGGAWGECEHECETIELVEWVRLY